MGGSGRSGVDGRGGRGKRHGSDARAGLVYRCASCRAERSKIRAKTQGCTVRVQSNNSLHVCLISLADGRRLQLHIVAAQ